MHEQDELKPRTQRVGNLSRQREGLRNRAYSEEGKREPFDARLDARVRATTVARLKLLVQDPAYNFSSIDDALDEAIHDYLNRFGY